MKTKTQCWEFIKCGRGKNGPQCMAVTQKAGRACWLVAGTLCGGQVQGTNAQKIKDCKVCDFYVKVKGGRI